MERVLAVSLDSKGNPSGLEPDKVNGERVVIASRPALQHCFLCASVRPVMTAHQRDEGHSSDVHYAQQRVRHRVLDPQRKLQDVVATTTAPH